MTRTEAQADLLIRALGVLEGMLQVRAPEALAEIRAECAARVEGESHPMRRAIWILLSGADGTLAPALDSLEEAGVISEVDP